MNIYKIFRPELTDFTLKLYDKESKIMKDEYDVEEEFDLITAIVDLSVEDMNLNHLFMGVQKNYQRNVRLAIVRNLLDIFENDIKPKNYEILDLLILEERFKNTNL